MLLYFSNIGFTVFLEAEVQHPNTTLTLCLVIRLMAPFLKSIRFDFPSTTIGINFLPLMPPASLIS